MTMSNEHGRMAELHRERAKRHYEAGEIKEAVEEFTEAYKFDPRDAEVLYKLAEIYGAAGFIDPAVDFIQKSLRENFMDINSWVMLANLYAQKGGAYMDLALEQLNQAMGIDANNTMVYYLRGNIMAQKGKKDEALENLKKALELDPANPYAKHDLEALTAAG
ncbi:MAG: tetratricopeptide repeat protein [bacterium]|nr:tetratricopeptide repeat protein [bacterium]